MPGFGRGSRGGRGAGAGCIGSAWRPSGAWGASSTVWKVRRGSRPVSLLRHRAGGLRGTGGAHARSASTAPDPETPLGGGSVPNGPHYALRSAMTRPRQTASRIRTLGCGTLRVVDARCLEDTHKRGHSGDRAVDRRFLGRYAGSPGLGIETASPQMNGRRPGPGRDRRRSRTCAECRRLSGRVAMSAARVGSDGGSFPAGAERRLGDSPARLWSTCRSAAVLLAW